jgi:hypothetical protein
VREVLEYGKETSIEAEVVGPRRQRPSLRFTGKPLRMGGRTT